MKRVILAVILSVLLASAAAAGEEYMADVDFEPADFRGVKWQESLDKTSGMEEIDREEDGAEITCVRKGENMRFGGAELTSVQYVFVNRRLSMAHVVTQGDKNRDAMLAEAKSLFGKETLRMNDDYMWRFTNVMVMFSKEEDDRYVLFYKYIGFLNK